VQFALPQRILHRFVERRPSLEGSFLMSEIRNDNFVCFVHGHGANYSSTPHEKIADARQLPLSARALAFARERAEAQLAFQRAAGKPIEKK
jgi:hypothetical protein